MEIDKYYDGNKYIYKKKKRRLDLGILQTAYVVVSLNESGKSRTSGKPSSNIQHNTAVMNMSSWYMAHAWLYR